MVVAALALLPMNYNGRNGSQRFTATIPGPVAAALERRAAEEGRSVSNLVAYLLERSLEELRQQQ